MYCAGVLWRGNARTSEYGSSSRHGVWNQNSVDPTVNDTSDAGGGKGTARDRVGERAAEQEVRGAHEHRHAPSLVIKRMMNSTGQEACESSPTRELLDRRKRGFLELRTSFKAVPARVRRGAWLLLDADSRLMEEMKHKCVSIKMLRNSW